MPTNRGWSGMPRAEKKVDEWPGDEKVQAALKAADINSASALKYPEQETVDEAHMTVLAAALRAKQAERDEMVEKAANFEMDKHAAEKEVEGLRAELAEVKAALPGLIASIQFGTATRQSGIVAEWQSRALEHMKLCRGVKPAGEGE